MKHHAPRAYPPGPEPCPGCGHPALHRALTGALARALEGNDRAGRLITLTTPGCGSLARAGLGVDVGEAGREGATALARGVKLARPESLVLAYELAGPLGGAGLAGLLALAAEGPGITVALVNLQPPLPGDAAPPDRLALLAQAGQWAVLERTAVGSPDQDENTAQALDRALAAQEQGQGPGLVEVLAPCPEAWGMTPEEAAAWVNEGLPRLLPLGDRRAGRGCG